MTTTEDEQVVENGGQRQIRLTVPHRLYLVPGAALIVGASIGIIRGGRAASLRFLAENAHRPPRTVQGWYFYNKTKNYKVMLAGLRGAGVEAGRLAAVALGWVGIEEGLQRAGWGELREVGAAVGTAGVFSAVYRLSWKVTRRTVLLGLAMGCMLKGLAVGREQLAKHALEMEGNSL